MEISFQDRSNYSKGILLLLGKEVLLDKGESEIDQSFEIAHFFKIKYEFDINISVKDYQEFGKPSRLTSNL